MVTSGGLTKKVWHQHVGRTKERFYGDFSNVHIREEKSVNVE